MNDDTLDTVGKALGFALSVYDQTSGAGAQLNRINNTRCTLADMIDDERFTPEVAEVLEGFCAGITTYMQLIVNQETGRDSGDGYLL